MLDIFSKKKKIISNNTKCRKQILNFVWNTWKYWWNETDDEVFLCTVSLNFEIYFLEFPWEIVVDVIWGNYIYICEKDCKIPKLFWYQIFVHLELKLLDLPSDFLLICCT